MNIAESEYTKIKQKKLFHVGIDDFFLFTFVLWLIGEIVFGTTIESIAGVPKGQLNTLLNVLISFMLMIQLVLFQTYKRREFLAIIVVSLILLLSAINSGYLSIVSTWLFIVAAKNVEYKQLIVWAKRILQVMIPVVILLYLFGIIENYTMYRGTQLRQSLGFSNPNQLGLRIFQLVACSIYLTGEKHLKMPKIVIYVIGCLFIYLIPNSQAATGCLLLLIIGVLVFELIKNNRRKKAFAGLLIAGSVMANFGSVILSMVDLSHYPILKKIDKLLSIRFSAGHRVYELYGIKWMGQTVYVSEKERELVGIKEKMWLDNSYMTLLIRYGVLVYLLFTICFLYLLWKLYKIEEYKLLVILAVYSIYGIIENSVYMITHNIFIIFLGMLLYRNRVQRDSKGQNSYEAG